MFADLPLNSDGSVLAQRLEEGSLVWARLPQLSSALSTMTASRVLVLNLERRAVGFAGKANDLREGVLNL